jgi:hypothetical protein
MIAEMRRRVPRPSCDASASLRPRRRLHSPFARDEAGDEGLGDRLRQARRRLWTGVGRNAGLARDDGGIAVGIVNEVNLS